VPGVVRHFSLLPTPPGWAVTLPTTAFPPGYGIADSRPELLARHCIEAGLVEKSVAWWAKAGRRSVARSAMVEAAAQLQKGLDQLGLLPDTHERQGQELEFWSALGAVLIAVKGQARAMGTTGFPLRVPSDPVWTVALSHVPR
jgi:hypothetical protein